MKDNRLSLLCAVALAFGCSAGVSGKTGSGGTGTGTGGSGGSTSSGGHGGSSSTGGSNGTGGSTGTGGSSSGNTDASLDGACAASTVGAQPVPLDLYFLMDSSKSMNDQTGAGTTKWAAVSSALNTFFTDSGSAGLGVALKYFPDEQSESPKATCAMTTGLHGQRHQLRCVRLQEHLRLHQRVDDGGVTSLSQQQRLHDSQSPQLRTHQAVRHQQLLRGQRNGNLRNELQLTSPATATCATSAPPPNTPPRTSLSGRSPGPPAGSTAR